MLRIFVLVILMVQVSEAEERYFPVSFRGETIISLGGKSLPKEISKRLHDIFSSRKKEKEEGAEKFYIDGDLKKEVLMALKVPSEARFYYFSLGSNEVGQISMREVSRLYVQINAALDAPGVIGVPIYDFTSSVEATDVRGLAMIADSNPFGSVNLRPVQWKSLGQSPFGEPVAKVFKPKRKKSSYIQQSRGKETFQSFSGSGFQLNYGLGELIEKDNPSGYKEEAFWLQIKSGKKVLKDVRGQGTYSYKPGFFYEGQLSKADESVLVINSIGMGDCGHIYKVDKKGQLTEIDLDCGAWGC